MGNSARKTSVPPLDFSSFLDAHRLSEAGKHKRGYKHKPKKNRFGNIPPKSSLKKKGNGDGPPPRMTHGVTSKWVLNRYADKRTPEGKALLAMLKGIERDIGKPFDARQSLLISLIRSKIIVIMQIGKYLESQEEIVDYEKGSVAHVVDKTFFHASHSLQNALNNLYSGKNANARGKKTYEELVAQMGKDEK